MIFFFLKILIRLSKLCVQNKKCRNQHQRLLKNMGAHSVVLDLLKIPYEKVSYFFWKKKKTILIWSQMHNQSIRIFSLNYVEVSHQGDQPWAL